MAAHIDRERFRALHERGLAGSRIAEELGCSTLTVYRIRKELGLKTAAVRMTPERKAQIQAALDDGQSWMEIKKTFGVQHETMARHFPGTQWTREQTKEHVAAVLTLGRELYQANYAQTTEQRKKKA